MRKYNPVLLLLFLLPVIADAQYKSRLNKAQWVDSVFNSLTDDQRIAQLMVIRAHSNLGPDHVAKVVDDIQKYNVGALCFFQGGPVRQANLTNYYQQLAQTPLMVTIDGEWGLGMRLDSVTKFPYQLTIGAVSDPNLVYRMGLAVGEQCKRIGVHVNYAPVVDVNNNPNNPVIGFRSFGEDKEKVAKYGVAYTKGMQDAGIMACAKHFPGHGDVDVDSHLDLPVINKSMSQLDSLELYPFKAQFDAGVGSVMIAHLYIPAIDNTANKATSISKNNVTDLLRNSLHYNGLTFTDALEMKGVAKYFPGGTIAVEAIYAGNDMLCLPENVGESIAAIKKAIAENRFTWEDIYSKVRKVLTAKYELGLNKTTIISTDHLVEDLNAKTEAICREVAAQGITLLEQSGSKTESNLYVQIPLREDQKKIAYVGIGVKENTTFGQRLQADLRADSYFFAYKDSDAQVQMIINAIDAGKYDAVVIGIHNYANKPMGNFGFSANALRLYKSLNSLQSVTFTFGNVLANKNFCDANSLVACYQDDAVTQDIAADILEGKRQPAGHLPVTVCRFHFGDGIVWKKKALTETEKQQRLLLVDSVVNDALAQKAFPGCVVLAVHKGQIIYHKAFGNYTFDPSSPKMIPESIFDLASVTKVSATTVSIMKLYEEGKLSLDGTLGDYLPWVRGSNKAGLTIRNILLHQAGLVPFIAFYKETINSNGTPKPGFYKTKPETGYTVRVADSLYLRNDWEDTILQRILQSPVSKEEKYVYSDNDFIFLGKIVEQLSGLTLDQYTRKTFYNKLGMYSTGFSPRNRFPVEAVVPTETDNYFRHQVIQADVHDEGAAMFGGVAGHAGLFSSAYDLSLLYQMLLNGGELNHIRILRPETIKLFTAYSSKISRRGLGFDKPEKDNQLRKDPYPALLASPAAFGHTGFTGTCVWVDPDRELVYIFLSNRVNPTRDNNKLSQLSVRGHIQDALYYAIGAE